MAGCVPTGNPARGRDVACYVRRPVVFLKIYSGGLLISADHDLRHAPIFRIAATRIVAGENSRCM